MNIKKIEEVILLMEKHGLTEIAIEEEGVKIHLKKGASNVIEKEFQIVPPAKETSAPAKKEERNLVEIKAPMVGTFYRSPAPDAKSFVETGNMIKDGDILCIIEAMKLMNEIKSEIKGKIVDILVENGEPVEFGQVLFLVEPA
ncbi:MAG: acetyl-CoA carboxylase biotin carboxyl carrier protein [Candidatus Omnitrophica bacterium]|nr:acetyl-CoA carboxylase biotin carboxyl carrier protein [Candidatus Omnitrophota bacterium]